MRERFSRAAVILLCVTAAAGVQAAEPRIAFESQGDTLAIRVEGRPLATYVYRDPQILRPYFKDVCAPGGIQVTRHHPPREGLDPVDHATMHPGLWLAFGDLGGADFWRNKATVEHGGFVQPPHVEGDTGTFTVRNRYLAGGSAICEEICTYTFQVRPAGYLILWDSTFQSQQSGVAFGDQEEMGLGVRVASALRVKGGRGTITNSLGGRDEAGTWGRQAAWCDYSGVVDGHRVGVTIMSASANDRHPWFHTRDYGLMVANPFGKKANVGDAGKLPLEPGQPLRLRFGILIHAAHSEDNFSPAAAYQDYLKTAGGAASPVSSNRPPS